MKLTTRTTRGLTLPPGKADVIVFDDTLSGFGYRMRIISGRLRKSWVVQYRRAGASRRLLLGSADVLSAEQARNAARKALAEIALGRDPQQERRDRRDRDKVTLRAVVAEYIAAKQDELRPHTVREITRYLTAPPYFGALFGAPIDTVTRRDVALRLAAIIRERGPIVASKARAALSAVFVWAMRMGIAEHNVVIGTQEPKGGTPRERVLSDDELRRVWLACGDDDYGRIIRLLILLGQRRQEIGGMAWSELDLESPQSSWRLPAERSKNARPHVLPLLPTAVAIIRGVPRMASRTRLFGMHAACGFAGWDKGKRALHARSGVTGWTPHDLRRTLSTRLHDMGVAPHIVEAVLNHVSGHKHGVAGIYNRASYENEKRAALTLWADKLLEVVEGRARKVVPLRA